MQKNTVGWLELSDESITGVSVDYMPPVLSDRPKKSMELTVLIDHGSGDGGATPTQMSPPSVGTHSAQNSVSTDFSLMSDALSLSRGGSAEVNSEVNNLVKEMIDMLHSAMRENVRLLRHSFQRFKRSDDWPSVVDKLKE